MQVLALNVLKHIMSMASCWRQRKLFILIYHRVLDEVDFMRPGEVDKIAFNWQMQLLAKYFNVLPMAEALEKLQNNNLPPRAVVITFDDGYADNLHNALPILKEHNLTATFFIASGFLDGGRMWNDTIIESIRLMSEQTLDLSAIGLGSYSIVNYSEKAATASAVIKRLKHLKPKQRSDFTQFIGNLVTSLPDDLMLTSDELKTLHDEGMEIGGHTVSHPILATLDDAAVNDQILDNKAFLTQLLGVSPRFFAYPNGKLNEDYKFDHCELVRNNGYQCALSTHVGVVNQESDLWQLPRFTPWDSTPIAFMIRMCRTYLSVL